MTEPQLKVALVALNEPGYQSLALGYLRAFAEAAPRLQRKAAFQTLDLTTEVDPWWVAYRVLRMAPDVVGFSVMCWNASAVYEACRLLRSAQPEIVIVVGGPEVAPQAQDVLTANPAIDAVVRGEGEETFAEMLETVLAKKRIWMCKGVTARDESGTIVSAQDREPIDQLDSIPSPYATGVLVPTETSSYIETYRGCPHRCAYCFEAKGLTGIRSFSKERIAADIAIVANSPGVKTFSFIDSVFNLTNERLGWLTEILEPYAQRGIRLHTIEVDIERIGPMQADMLRRAGVESVETGPQTIGATALQMSNRAFDPKRFVAGVQALKDAGIRVECDLIIGLPGDDAYNVISGLRWLVEIDPGIVQSSTLRVLPGTDLAFCARDIGLAYASEPDHAVVQTAEISFANIRRLEVMSAALQAGYRARL